MKRVALMCASVVVGLVGLTGCGGSSSKSSGSGSGSSAASGSGGGGSPIKIAVLEPTSGPLGSIGTQIADSAKYAADYVNAHGGVNGGKFQVTVHDTQLNPSTAATDYQQATQDDNVAVLGPLISPEVNAAVPVAKRTSTPMLIPGAADISFTKPVQQYVFRVGSNESQDDAAMAKLATQLHCTKPALLYDNGALGLSTKSDIAHDIPHFAISLQTSETATDLTPALQKIRSAGAQCIIEATDALGAVGSMISTMANTGYKVPVLGDSGITLAPFVATAGKSLDKVPVYGTDTFNPDSSYFKHLFAGFASGHGALPPGEEIASSWDSVMLLAAALKADGGKGGSDLAGALAHTSGKGLVSLIGYKGPTPTFSADSHDWVPDASDRLYRVTPGPKGEPKLTPAGA